MVDAKFPVADADDTAIDVAGVGAGINGGYVNQEVVVVAFKAGVGAVDAVPARKRCFRSGSCPSGTPLCMLVRVADWRATREDSRPIHPATRPNQIHMKQRRTVSVRDTFTTFAAQELSNVDKVWSVGCAHHLLP